MYGGCIFAELAGLRPSEEVYKQVLAAKPTRPVARTTPKENKNIRDCIVEHNRASAQEFLADLFFVWPTLPRPSEKLKKYGNDITTWPLSEAVAKAAIMS